MLGRLTCILVAMLGVLAGFLLAAKAAPAPRHKPRGPAGRALSAPPRQTPRGAQRPSSRRSKTSDGSRSPRKPPAKGKPKPSRPKKNS